MTPGEVQTIVEAAIEATKGQEASNGPLYLLIVIFSLVVPYTARMWWKQFKVELGNIVEEQTKVTNKLIETRHAENEEAMKAQKQMLEGQSQIMEIMQMHIEELVHVRDKLEDHGGRIEKLEGNGKQ